VTAALESELPTEFQETVDYYVTSNMGMTSPGTDFCLNHAKIVSRARWNPDVSDTDWHLLIEKSAAHYN
jgi:hypothetical protein